MKFRPGNHIVGRVYDLNQFNMCAMLDYIDKLESVVEEAQRLLDFPENTARPHSLRVALNLLGRKEK